MLLCLNRVDGVDPSVGLCADVVLFKAVDGIEDRVASRGLGVVYSGEVGLDDACVSLCADVFVC